MQCPFIRSTRTLRIRQSDGFNLSIESSISPLWPAAMLALSVDHALAGEVQKYPLSHFHEISWAVGPLGQSGACAQQSRPRKKHFRTQDPDKYLYGNGAYPD